jgi:hypothetical protein
MHAWQSVMHVSHKRITRCETYMCEAEGKAKVRQKYLGPLVIAHENNYAIKTRWACLAGRQTEHR